MSEETQFYGSYDLEEVRQSGAENLDFFSALCMPEDATENYPPIYWQLFGILTAAFVAVRDFSKFAIGLPRGHGKTMFIKLLVVWAILFSKKKFILIIGASAERAEDMLSDIVDILDSENIQNAFGNWRANLDKDTKNYKKFTFGGRPVIIKAVGAMTAMRGITVKNKRPDLMIFDDAQTSDCAASVTESLRFRKWFRGTALKAKAPDGCTFCYIGNMYADLELSKNQYSCVLRNLQRSREWTSYIVGAILSDGSALWEEVQPIEQLLAEFRDDLDSGTPEIFFFEVLNDPQAASATDIDLSKIVYKEPVEHELHQGNFIIIDPSNDKKQSDATAIGYYEIYDAVPNLTRVFAEQLSGPELVYKVLELCQELGCSLVFVESEAYQYSLLGWFNFVCSQLNMDHVVVEPLYTRGVSKNSRILNMFKSLVKGDITLHPRVAAPVIMQISKFNRLTKDNEDDILDILAYSEQVIANYTHLLIMDGLGEVIDETDFSQIPKVDSFDQGTII